MEGEAVRSAPAGGSTSDASVCCKNSFTPEPWILNLQFRGSTWDELACTVLLQSSACQNLCLPERTQPLCCLYLGHNQKLGCKQRL